MSYINNIILDVYSLAILSYLLAQTVRMPERETLSSRLYRGMLAVSMLVLVGDALSWFEGGTTAWARLFVDSGNFVVFLFNTVVPTLYVLYVHDQVWQDKHKTFRWFPLLAIIFLFNAVMLVISQFTGWYYHIDQNNVYHRGPLFFLPIAQLVLLVLIPSLLVLKHRNKLERSTLYALALFPIPPGICVVLQMLFYGVNLMPHGLAFSLLIVFLRIQNKHLHTDFLTGVYNRKKFETVLKARIRDHTPGRELLAILIDIDNFKEINDTHGHDMGDMALEDAAKLLRANLRADDLVARIGGDEFAVVLGTPSVEALDRTVQRLRDALRQNGRAQERPYRLDFSMGSDAYDPQRHPTPEAFFKQLDILMYQDKAEKKAQNA